MKNNWIDHPVFLLGNHVDLLPLEKSHFAELFLAASDKELWNLIPTDCSKKTTFNKMYSLAIKDREKGRQYPFIIFHKETNRIIGSTRLFDIYPDDKKVEIGWTWVIQEFWGSVVNLECKFLLLSFCFEHLKVRRVQIKTDELNKRSRKAIEKIGGIFEGVLRKDKIKSNGDSRNAAYYSIIDEEWEGVKQNIRNLIDMHQQNK